MGFACTNPYQLGLDEYTIKAITMSRKKPLYCSATMSCPPSVFLPLFKNSLSINLREKITIIEQLNKFSNHQIYSFVKVWIEERQKFAELMTASTHERQAIEQIMQEAKADWEVLTIVYHFPDFADDPNTLNQLARHLQTFDLAEFGRQLDVLTNKNADEQQRLFALQYIDPHHTLNIHADDFLDQVKGRVGKLLLDYQKTSNALLDDDLLTSHLNIKQ